jgi:hypothetical protein
MCFIGTSLAAMTLHTPPGNKLPQIAVGTLGESRKGKHNRRCPSWIMLDCQLHTPLSKSVIPLYCLVHRDSQFMDDNPGSMFLYDNPQGSTRCLALLKRGICQATGGIVGFMPSFLILSLTLGGWESCSYRNGPPWGTFGTFVSQESWECWELDKPVMV